MTRGYSEHLQPEAEWPPARADRLAVLGASVPVSRPHLRWPAVGHHTLLIGN